MQSVSLCIRVQQSKPFPVRHERLLSLAVQREGDVRAMAPAAIQKQIYQMLPLDLTLYGSFQQELIFGWEKEKVVSHLLSEKLREGKEGGKRGRGREKHCHNYMEFYLYIHMFISTYTFLNLLDNVW